jgi:hypothetical protein
MRYGRFPVNAGVVLVIAATAAGGCATRSKISASNEIATAQFAIRDARASGAGTYAVGVLDESEALVKEAERAGGEEAERLAEKALVRARLASAVAARESARQRLADAQRMKRDSDDLRKRTTRAVEEKLR